MVYICLSVSIGLSSFKLAQVLPPFWINCQTENHQAGLQCAVGSASDCRSRDCKFEYQLGHITYIRIDHEIISMVILPLNLIEEGQLAVTGKSMYTKYM